MHEHHRRASRLGAFADQLLRRVWTFQSKMDRSAPGLFEPGRIRVYQGGQPPQAFLVGQLGESQLNVELGRYDAWQNIARRPCRSEHVAGLAVGDMGAKSCV